MSEMGSGVVSARARRPPRARGNDSRPLFLVFLLFFGHRVLELIELLLHALNRRLVLGVGAEALLELLDAEREGLHVLLLAAIEKDQVDVRAERLVALGETLRVEALVELLA